MSAAVPPVVVAEDDVFLRMLQVVLDPDAPAERVAAFADFFSHEEPDFAGYRAKVRARAKGLYPARVLMVEDQQQLRNALPEAAIVAVEALAVGRDELARAPRLKLVQRYGLAVNAVDPAACAERGVRVLTFRRRANIACAEHAMALILVQARRLDKALGRVTEKRLAEIGYRLKPFDRRHTPNSNWARIPGLRLLHGRTLGLIGVGEIGREIATRAVAFGMRVLYFQRRRMAEADEQRLGISYAPLDTLVAEADWLVPQLPQTPATHHIIDAARLARMKKGAYIVNVSRPDVIDRAALIAALKSGHLGGFALDPLYQSPMQDDDELLQFDNVVLTPHLAAQPRWNALDDLCEIMEGMAHALAR
jgi:phosphoglycerate dehydrogenase-like enzyme